MHQTTNSTSADPQYTSLSTFNTIGKGAAELLMVFPGPFFRDKFSASLVRVEGSDVNHIR